MFLGTMTAPERAVVHELARKEWRDLPVYNAFSGNMTVAKLVQDYASAVHTCDVTLYSACLGQYMAGRDLEFHVRSEALPRWGWLNDYLGTMRERMALLLIASDMTMGAKSGQHETEPGVYYERIWRAYRKQWNSIWPKVLEKVDAMEMILSSNHVGDAMTWIDEVPDEAAFVAYTPFYRGGYESLNRSVDMVFEWNKPDYEVFDPKISLPILMEKVQRFDAWLIGTPEFMPDYADRIVHQARSTVRQVPVYLYGSSEQVRRTRQPEALLAEVHWPIIDKSVEITPESEFQLIVLEMQEMRYLRSIYCSRHINPASKIPLTIGCLVDGYLIGAWGITFPGSGAGANFGNTKRSTNTVFVITDFAVNTSSYPRLSKLLLYALCSIESRQMIQNTFGKYCDQLLTVAITTRPMSMKYRGLFTLNKRQKHNSTQPSTTFTEAGAAHGIDDDRYLSLTYESPAGRWSLEDGLAEWCRKHGKRADDAD